MSQILLLSNEATTSAIMTKLLRTEGYKVVVEATTDSGLRQMKADEFNLMILGSGKGFDPNLATVREAKELQPAMPVIVLIDAGDTVTEGAAADLNVFACIKKPLKVNEFLACVNKAVDFNDAALAEGMNLNLQLEASYEFDGIIAESAAMKRVSDMISRVASVDVAVLISGERGTGKKGVGRAIHIGSKRKENPLVEVDCDTEAGRTLLSAVAKPNAFVQANKGTLFLRNIEGMTKDVQAWVLGVLHQKRTVGADGAEVVLDVRMVSSCCGDMAALISEGKFDAGLLKFLKVIPINLPPVRERPTDILPLVKHAIRQQIGDNTVLPSIEGRVADKLEKYSWPGNVTEIEEVVAHILQYCKSGGTVTFECLPEKLREIS